MVHDFDRTLCFMGGNIRDLFDFKAVIELIVGEEEKILDHVSHQSHIPAGIPQGPLEI